MGDLVVVAGARKAGTSWLYEAAASDDRFAVPTIRKELNFFDDHFHRGLGWYRAQFGAGSRVGLDCSPGYFAQAQVPARIAAATPEARLVFVLRDPIERLVSDFHHARRRGDLPASVTVVDAVRRMPSLLEESRYARQLERWLEEPGLGELLVIFFDDLARDPQCFYDRFCEAAGLPALPLPDERLDAVFERAEARSAGVMRVAMAGVRFLHRRNLSRVTRPFTRSARLRRLVERPPGATDRVAPDEVAPLRAQLADDTTALAAMLREHPRLVTIGPVPSWAEPA